MKVVAVLQARCSSTRLPGKVLKPILGQPMILRQIERIRRCRTIDCLVLATSVEPADDRLAELCEKSGVFVYRGSLDDVLDRFLGAATPFAPECVVRLTGDCPLADPELIDAVVAMHLEGGFDYTSNTLDPTFPDGLDVEVVQYAVLQQAWRDAQRKSEREHVTSYIYTHPELFKLNSFKGGRDLSSLRWTVDEPADFELIKRIYSCLYPSNPAFTTKDIEALLDQCPEMKRLNLQFQRNEGYQKSLEADER